MKQKSIIIITGFSGSGKSTALSTFEDTGFYCIDNMPIKLLGPFLKLPKKDTDGFTGYAFVMDMRDKSILNEFSNARQTIKKASYQVRILFLETDVQVLIQRFSQTRRRHPLGNDGSLVGAIEKEGKLLSHLRTEADHIIDTTHFSVHELKFTILNIAQQYTAISRMSVNVVSFGFKRGAPPDADVIIDVRFLTNPYFDPELKPKSGEDKAVRQFVLNDPETNEFLIKYLDLLDYLIPRYEKEGKAYLTIAVGCTGGMHRSVVIAQKVYEHIRSHQLRVRLIHRDLRSG
jgi:UPF0042 nucleotide-binding protein